MLWLYPTIIGAPILHNVKFYATVDFMNHYLHVHRFAGLWIDSIWIVAH